MTAARAVARRQPGRSGAASSQHHQSFQPGLLQIRSAEGAVHIYASMANCYELYHNDADLIFITGLVEVVSRAQSSKAALSELFRFF